MTTLRVPGVVWAVTLAVAGLAALAVWDEARESTAALDDLADHEATTSRLLAAELRARLGDVAHGSGGGSGAAVDVDSPAAVAALLADLAPVIESGAARVLLLAPEQSSFIGVDGHIVDDAQLRGEIAAGRRSSRLSREEAASLGLPERTAFAGIADVDAGRLGHFVVVTVASAERERDRERRAAFRIAFGVLVTGGLVAAFGGIALRRQRRELEVSRALAVAEVEQRGEERLAAASRAATLGTMALGIAHELSTPLAVIAGRANQILARASDDERATKSARAIVDQTDRISDVVRGFLALARGKDPTIDRLDPRAVVEAAVGLVEHRFAKAHVSLRPAIDEDRPRIHGDPRLLEQALVNLLLNACDACAAGGRVDVIVQRGEGVVTFTVLDDGAGISPENLAHVTEPFFTTKAHGEGSGIGLAVALEIVKSHRGTLTIAPRAPHGTRADISLPVSSAIEEA